MFLKLLIPKGLAPWQAKHGGQVRVESTCGDLDVCDGYGYGVVLLL
jgi:hypothetical protein